MEGGDPGRVSHPFDEDPGLRGGGLEPKPIRSAPPGMDGMHGILLPLCGIFLTDIQGLTELRPVHGAPTVQV